MKMKRKIIFTLIGVLVPIAATAVILAEGTVVGNWRMRIVARQLEQSESLRATYGAGSSITLLKRGLQPGESFHGYVYHMTPFQVQGDGVDKRIWVKWSNRNGRLDVRVHGFTETETPYTDMPGIVK